MFGFFPSSHFGFNLTCSSLPRLFEDVEVLWVDFVFAEFLVVSWTQDLYLSVPFLLLGDGLARSKAHQPRKAGRFYYAIPIIAVLIIATAFVVAYVLPPPSDVAVSYDVALEIQVAYNRTSSQLVAPPVVGVRGGYWYSHLYDLYGADGRYPLYTDATPDGALFSVIHVRSRVVQNYTLGDFFDVWGQPLGPSQTLDRYPADNVSTFWQMCVGFVGSQPTGLGNWRSELLAPNKFIVLVYYFAGGSGCL